MRASSSTPKTELWRPEFRGLPTKPDAPGADEGEAPSSPDELWQPLRTGLQLPGSRLRILEHINDGGCGVVYRGEHIDLRRAVAIKVQRVERLTSDAREMFLDEARATTRVESPYVVQVVDFGELPDGRVWYAMELLGGQSLDELMAGVREPEVGRMDLARAIALLRMACKGLAAAHAAGVVHRDVKPQNLVVVERGGREHLVLVDFGIAIALGTTPDSVCGTPEYMSREQIVCDPLDARTDIYGLAVCAYELFTGRSLVNGCTVAEALARHEHGVAPIFEGSPAVPPALQALVRRCLAAAPVDRVQTMGEFEAALCEAQIDARLPNLRSDLELPQVAAPRRDRIAGAFASLARSRSDRVRRWITAGAVVAGTLGVLTLWLRDVGVEEPTTTDAAASPSDDSGALVSRAELPLGIAAGAHVAGTSPQSPAVSVLGVVPLAAPTTAAPTTAAPTTVTPIEAATRASPHVPRSERRTTTARRDAIREGHRALRRGDYVEAEDAFARALHLDARSAGAASGLAAVNFERGKHVRALHYAQLAVALDPRSAAHRLRLGDSYYRLSRDADARTAYLAAERMGASAAAGRLDALARRAGR